MINNTFYSHVSAWINSYFNVDSLNWMKKFVDNSNEDQEIKDVLHREINRKKCCLSNIPHFDTFYTDDNTRYFMNSFCQPKVFTTRYSANNELTQFIVQGYEVELIESDNFFKIKLISDTIK